MAHLPDQALILKNIIKKSLKGKEKGNLYCFVRLMLATCFVTDFLIGQHLIGHPINSHLNCAQPFIVSQPTEFILQPKIVLSHLFFQKLIELSFRS